MLNLVARGVSRISAAQLRTRHRAGWPPVPLSTVRGDRADHSLAVEKDAAVGYHTPGLSPWARIDYADLLGELERGLVLAQEPKLTAPVGGLSDTDGEADEDIHPAVSPGSAGSPLRYVFASCRCQNARRHLVTIRVAKVLGGQGAFAVASARNRSRSL